MSLARPAIAPRQGDRFFQAGLKLLQMLVEIGVKRFEEVNCEHYTLIVPFVARVERHAGSRRKGEAFGSNALAQSGSLAECFAPTLIL